MKIGTTETTENTEEREMRIEDINLVLTLRVGTQFPTLYVAQMDAERPQSHPHAERGHEVTVDRGWRVSHALHD